MSHYIHQYLGARNKGYSYSANASKPLERRTSEEGKKEENCGEGKGNQGWHTKITKVLNYAMRKQPHCQTAAEE